MDPQKQHPHHEWERDIETYRKSQLKSTDKAFTTQELVTALTAATPELSETKLDDSLKTYLCMLEQHDQAISDA